MPEKIDIYGSLISVPDAPDDKSKILYHDLPRKEQKWKRQELPEYFETVEYDKEGNLILTLEQEAYASEELRRCKEGVHAMIGGRVRFLPKRYYFYLQYYTLEDGTAPDFREADRLYYLFHGFWFLILWCLGIIRTKKRRQGASSQSCSNILYEAIFYKNSNCGLISKTKDDSKATFTEMITNAYQQLPVYLKPKLVSKEDSVTELIFSTKSQSIKGGVASAKNTDKGHNSKINYKAPVLNAYDRGRMSYVLLDEAGKLPKETPASKLLAIISKTLVKGVKRVGWIELPSTTNEMLKGGGMEFYKIWKKADQKKRKPTINRLVQFFQPAYEAYEGFIDEFGDSVIDTPTEEQYEYLVNKWVVRDEETGELISELSEEDIRLGARQYVTVKRREGLEGADLEEEMRMNPVTVEEAFMYAAEDACFNQANIKDQQKKLEDKPVFKRRILFYRKEDQSVTFRDAKAGEEFCWKVTQLPPEGQTNKYLMDTGLRKPARIADGAISVDSYSNSQGGRKYGSKASAWIGRRFDMTSPHDTGKPIGHLYGRPKEKSELHEQVMLAAEYYGYSVYYEHTADDYYSYFKERGRKGYLGLYPKIMIDPTKRADAERHRGTPITPFSLTKQLDTGIMYFNNYCDKIDYEELLENALIFDPEDRTAYDTVVSFLILITVLMEPVSVQAPKKEPMVKTYR
jgi:hypothetical protein